MLDRMAKLATTAAVVALALCISPTLASAQFGVQSFTTSTTSDQAGAHADFSTAFALETEALGNPAGQLKHVTVQLPAGLVGDPQAIERCSAANFQRFDCAPDAQVGVLEASLVSCRGVSTALETEAKVGESSITVASTADFCGAEPGNTIEIGSGGGAEAAKVIAVEAPHTLALEAPLKKAHAAGQPATHVGVAEPIDVPVFNLQASAGHTATLGASLLPATILIQVDVNPSGYGLTANIEGISTLVSLAGAKLTLWGVPAAEEHDPQRCTQEALICDLASGASPAAFMRNPTECGSSPLESTLTAESWQGESATSRATLGPFTGCAALKLTPELSVEPDTTQADAPAGYVVDLKVQQSQEPYGDASPDIREVSLTLPAGTSLSPAVGNGLQGCTQEQFETGLEGACPRASTVGSVEIASPLLAGRLTGSVYVGAPQPGETVTEKYRVFVVASGEHVNVKLTGVITPSPSNGQLTAVFQNLPQLPFSEFKMNINGGQNAALANPSTCGAATSSAQISSYAGQGASPETRPFYVDANGEGGACPASFPFDPEFSAGTTSPIAGEFSPFVLTIARADRQQQLAGVAVQLPPGLVGAIKSVPRCEEPLAAQGDCPAATQIGTATVAAGAGALPYDVSGPVFLTGSYGGASYAYGLTVAVRAAAGPFYLGTAVVRAGISVDPTDAHLTVVSGPLPTILAGVPLRLKEVQLDIDRPGFVLNPTSCEAMTVGGAISSAQGTVAAVSSPFRAGGCRGLAFTPSLTARTLAKTSKANGAALDVTIKSGLGQANIAKVKVDLPSQLPARLTTLNHACLASVFASDPASCPAQSLVGTGVAATPLLAEALRGPAYLVSYGSAQFPELVVLLRGDGIAINLVGQTHITKGIISAAFNAVPDVPVSSFEMTLPEGPHSLLSANGNLCSTKKLVMQTSLVGQNGAAIKPDVAIAVSGCPSQGHKKSRKR